MEKEKDAKVVVQRYCFRIDCDFLCIYIGVSYLCLETKVQVYFVVLDMPSDM